MRPVTVYGFDWCPQTQRVLQFLKQNRVKDQYFNLDVDREAFEVARIWYPGGIATPIVVLEMSGTRLVNPSDDELRNALISVELIDKAA